MIERQRDRTLLVASTGGHLEELRRLSTRIAPPVGTPDWVTFDDPQSRSLLAGERVHFVRYVPPRGYRPALANLASAVRILRTGGYERVVSTGSGIAVPFFMAARMLGMSCHYIESAARAEGPSMTGRIVSRVPGVHAYSQYPSWSNNRWAYRGSLFDSYQARAPEPDAALGHTPASRVVVTLGTMRTYGFRRAIERLCAVLPDVVAADAEVLWQVGTTDTAGLAIAAKDRVPAAELTAAIAEADLVVAHAGIGSALTALDHGKCPVLLPRRRQFGEHVDDHQQMIASGLAARGLAVAPEVADLSAAHLWTAMATRIRESGELVPFQLS